MTSNNEFQSKYRFNNRTLVITFLYERAKLKLCKSLLCITPGFIRGN